MPEDSQTVLLARTFAIAAGTAALLWELRRYLRMS